MQWFNDADYQITRDDYAEQLTLVTFINNTVMNTDFLKNPATEGDSIRIYGMLPLTHDYNQ